VRPTGHGQRQRRYCGHDEPNHRASRRRATAPLRHALLVLVHLDTDLGGDTDDACALAMLLGWPAVDVVGVTTTIDPGGRRAGCVAELLEIAGSEWHPGGGGCRGVPDDTADCMVSERRGRAVLATARPSAFVIAGCGARPPCSSHRARCDAGCHWPVHEPRALGGRAAWQPSRGSGRRDGGM